MGRYHVLHVPRTADVIDETRSMIVRDSIGDLPELFPFGQFQRIAFNHDAPVPPLFALPFHVGLAVFSAEFVDLVKRERLCGLQPVEAFDTDVDTVIEDDGDAGGELVTLREAIGLVSVSAKPVGRGRP